MTYSLDIHPEAAREFWDAVEWYEAQSQGLGSRFEGEVLRALRLINDKPETGTYIRNPYRQLAVAVFPFVIVYKIVGARKIIFISSVFHTGRYPDLKFR